MSVTEEARHIAHSAKADIVRLEAKYGMLDEKLDKALSFASKGHLAPFWFLVYAVVVGFITWHIRGWVG